jgi:hypothetical protein
MKKLRFFLCVIIGLSLILSACCSSVNPGGGAGNDKGTGDDNGGNKTSIEYPVYTVQRNAAQTELTVTGYKADKTTEKTVYQIYGAAFAKGAASYGTYSALPSEYQTKAQADAAVAQMRASFDSNRSAIAGSYLTGSTASGFTVREYAQDGAWTDTKYALYGVDYIVDASQGTWYRASETAIQLSGAYSTAALPSQSAKIADPAAFIEQQQQAFQTHHNEVIGAYKTESTNLRKYTSHTVYRFNDDDTYSVSSYYLWGQTWETAAEMGTWSRTSATNVALKKTGSASTTNYTLNLADKMTFDAIDTWTGENRQLYLDHYESDPLVGVSWVDRGSATYYSSYPYNKIEYRRFYVLTFNKDGTHTDITYRLRYDSDSPIIQSSRAECVWDRANETVYYYDDDSSATLYTQPKMTRTGNSLNVETSVGGVSSDYVRVTDLEAYFADELAAIRATWE